MYNRTLLPILAGPVLLGPTLAAAQLGNSDLGQVLIIGPDGQPSGILADDLDTPRGTALAADGTFFQSVTGGLGGAGGFVLRVNPDGTSEPFITDISPFDLEIGPGGDLFVSDASNDNILRVPTSGPDEGVVSVFTSGFTPSGLGFAPNGSLYAGIQPSDPTQPGTGGLAEVLPDGTNRQVGVLDSPFDVQVDANGNVFANNSLDFGGTAGLGEIAFFPGLGAEGAASPDTPLASQTFAPLDIRGLAIGPVGTDIENEVFASTGDFTIVKLDPFDPTEFDPSQTGEIFAGPPVSDIGDPFAFDIQFLPGGEFQLLVATDDITVVPEPATLALLTLAPFTLRRRR